MPFDGRSDAVTDLLREAKHKLETRGWCQESFINQDGALCMLGALGYRRSDELFDSLEETETMRAARERLGFALYGRDAYTEDIIIWNDRRSATKAKVLGAFDKAIAGV